LLLAHLVSISTLQDVEIIITSFAWLKFAQGFLILLNLILSFSEMFLNHVNGFQRLLQSRGASFLSWKYL